MACPPGIQRIQEKGKWVGMTVFGAREGQRGRWTRLLQEAFMSIKIGRGGSKTMQITTRGTTGHDYQEEPHSE